MKIPEGATRVSVDFGRPDLGVFIQSPSHPDDEPGKWTVWDRRPVRQGARQIAHGLSFQDASDLAKRLEKESIADG